MTFTRQNTEHCSRQLSSVRLTTIRVNQNDFNNSVGNVVHLKFDREISTTQNRKNWDFSVVKFKATKFWYAYIKRIIKKSRKLHVVYKDNKFNKNFLIYHSTYEKHLGQKNCRTLYLSPKFYFHCLKVNLILAETTKEKFGSDFLHLFQNKEKLVSNFATFVTNLFKELVIIITLNRKTKVEQYRQKTKKTIVRQIVDTVTLA